MRVNLDAWNQFLKNQPNPHILQSGAWGELKSGFGWKPVRLITGEGGAQVLFRRLPGGFSIGYAAKCSPNLKQDFFSELDVVCREEKAIFVKMEPDLWEGDEIPEGLAGSGWQRSNPIQPRRTVVVSLEGTEDELLARMKQKTRYNIRLAEKKEITVCASDDVGNFHQLSVLTGKRDGFGIHSLDYYQKIFDLYHPIGQCELLLAFYQDLPVAGLMVIAVGERSWYMYGASSEVERNRMPTYLIQWEAMKWARGRGCKTYDLWGIPDLDEDQLEGKFEEKHSHEGLWGVYRFKRGFGGEVLRSVGAWDKIYFPGIYRLYQQYTRLRGGREE